MVCPNGVERIMVFGRLSEVRIDMRSYLLLQAAILARHFVLSKHLQISFVGFNGNEFW